MFEYIESKSKKLLGDNAATNCLNNCIRCCIDCLHRFIKFLNKNAYIQMALTGNGFCSSALVAMALAVKHAGSFFVTNGIGMLISMLGKLTIAVSNCVIAYFIIIKVDDINSKVQNHVGPLVVVFLFSYIMASIFMSVYQTTSLTILQCLYADVDLVDQAGGNKYSHEHRPAEMEDVVNMLRKDGKSTMRDSINEA